MCRLSAFLLNLILEGGSSEFHKVRKSKSRLKNEKGINLFLLADDMIVDTESLKESRRTLDRAKK